MTEEEFMKREALLLLQDDLAAKIAEADEASKAFKGLVDTALERASAEPPFSLDCYLARAAAGHLNAKIAQLNQSKLALENNRHWYRSRLVEILAEAQS